MTAYEVMYIAKSQLEEAKQGELVEKVKEVITSGEGTLKEVKLMGKKMLAVQFAKQTSGYYVIVNYEAAGSKVNKALENYFKINEDIIRHIIIKKVQPPVIKQKKAKKAKSAEGSSKRDE